MKTNKRIDDLMLLCGTFFPEAPPSEGFGEAFRAAALSGSCRSLPEWFNLNEWPMM